MSSMPTCKAERCGEQRRVTRVQDRHRSECLPGVGEFLLQRREAGRLPLEAKEKVRILDRAPFKTTVFADRGQAVPPHQLAGGSREQRLTRGVIGA